MTKRQFAVFDIDGTLIRWQLFHALADALAKLGYINTADYNHVRQARLDWKIRSSTDAFKTYEQLVVESFEKIIQKITAAELQTASEAVIEQYKDQVYTYTRQLITKLKADGYFLLAVSGSQRELIAMIADYYGFDDFVGTEYLQQNGKFTGEQIFHARDKKAALDKLIAKHDLALKSSIAIGDSTSDIPMLQLVEHPIAFNPELDLLTAAKAAGWTIVLERKNVVYELCKQRKTYLLR